MHPQETQVIAGVPRPHGRPVSVGSQPEHTPPETLPEKYKGRRFHQHNPTVTLMRTTPEEEATVQAIFDKHEIRKGQPVIVVNPGASFGTAKCWLPERFAEVDLEDV